MAYSVKEIFYTLQGEGAQAGRRVVADAIRIERLSDSSVTGSEVQVTVSPGAKWA